MAGDSEASRDPQPWSLLKLGPSQSEKGRDSYVRTFPLLAQVTQKRLDLVNQAQGELSRFRRVFLFPVVALSRATSFFRLLLISIHPFLPAHCSNCCLPFPFQNFTLLLVALRCSPHDTVDGH
jgi:hypothetical protein